MNSFHDLIHKIRESAIEQSTVGAFTKTALISFFPPNKYPDILDRYTDTTFRRFYSAQLSKKVARVIALTAPQDAEKRFAKFLTTHCSNSLLYDNFNGMSIPEIAAEAFSTIRKAAMQPPKVEKNHFALLSRLDIAKYLGISIPTLKTWMTEKNLPCYKIGGVIRFRLSEVDLWLEKYRTS